MGSLRSNVRGSCDYTVHEGKCVQAGIGFATSCCRQRKVTLRHSLPPHAADSARRVTLPHALPHAQRMGGATWGTQR